VEEGENLSWVALHSSVVLNSNIGLRVGAALGGILMLIWRATLRRNFDIKIGRPA
jgi:hypothetical protein